MFRIKDNFKSCTENQIPHSFSVERHSEIANLHIGVDDDGFSLKSVGNRFVLNTPSFVTGVFEAVFKVTFPQEFNPEFYVIFQYNRHSRQGTALKITCDLKRNCPVVSLAEVKGEVFAFADGIALEGVGIGNEEFVRLRVVVNNDSLVCFVNDAEACFEYNAARGHLAIERSNFIGELVFGEISFETDESYQKTELIPQTEVAIPCINGGDIPYRFSYGVTEIEGELYLDARLDGGTKTRAVNREDRPGQYVAERDFMEDPYVGVYSKEFGNFTFNMYNGVLGFIDPNIFWECLKPYFNDTQIPFEICCKLSIESLPDDVEFIFGYKNLLCTGYFSQTGGREFRFDKFGKVVYNGAPVDGKNIGDISSPKDKHIISLLPEDMYNYEDAVSHFENNHYFEKRESIKFTLDFKTCIQPEFIAVKAFMFDVYELEVIAGSDCVGYVSTWREGYHCIKYEAEFPPADIGVYKIKFDVLYGGEVIESYVRTFEVYSSESDVSPMEASGLPFIFSMNNELKWLERNSFDPWNPIPGCDVEHYISCVMATPVEALKRRDWIPAHILKRKWFCWLAPRTCRNFLSDEYDEIKRNADYIFYGAKQSMNFHPLSAGSILPFRADHWNYDNISFGIQRDVIDRFMEENPEISQKTGYGADGDLSYDGFEILMKTWGKKWIDYVNNYIAEIFVNQNKELAAYNPGIKRAAYGPINVYVTPTLSYRTVATYGLPCDNRLSDDIYTGFSIFEDYPYSCSYQTYRGAFTMMTILLHCPGLVMYPEQYKGGTGGCIDGAVKFAHAPMGKYTVDPSKLATQTFEYVFNTAYKTKEGFRYWNTYGFHRPDYKPEMMNGLIKKWKYVMQYKPSKPLRSIAYIAEFGEDDTSYEFPTVAEGRKRCVISNKSENGCALVWECSREAGVPCGFGLTFDTLPELSGDECDILVIPDLSNADAECVREIRRLYNEGVNLIALSDINGLEDVFCVEKSEEMSQVNTVIYRGKTECVLPLEARFVYRSRGAQVVVEANGHAAVLKTERTLLINTDVLKLGNSNMPQFNPSGYNHLVGELIRNAVQNEITRLSSPLAKGENVGVTLFETEKGQTVLMAVDYTPFDNKEHGVKQAVVKLNMADITDAKSDKKVLCGRKDGTVRELRFDITPHESVFVELINNI